MTGGLRAACRKKNAETSGSGEVNETNPDEKLNLEEAVAVLEKGQSQGHMGSNISLGRYNINE